MPYVHCWIQRLADFVRNMVKESIGQIFNFDNNFLKWQPMWPSNWKKYISPTKKDQNLFHLVAILTAILENTVLLELKVRPMYFWPNEFI